MIKRDSIERQQREIDGALFTMHEGYVRAQHKGSSWRHVALIVLLVVAAVAAGGITQRATAAEEEVITRTIYVHHVAGVGAWMQSPHHLVAKPRSHAAVKILAMQPGERVRLHGAKHGTYRVEGITFPPTKPTDEPAQLIDLAGWDLRMTVRGTERYVFCNRIR